MTKIPDLPKPLTQTEEIVWHQWNEGDQKPTESGGTYLVYFQCETIVGDGTTYFRETVKSLCYWDGFLWDGGENILDEYIIAWAELPKGWAE